MLKKFSQFFEELTQKSKTLYIYRQLINADEFLEHFKQQGFKKTLTSKDVHVTQAFSRRLVYWYRIPENQVFKLTVSNVDNRKVNPLGDKGAVVMHFRSDHLQDRWKEILDHGASWDYNTYHPHVTITYDGDGIDLSKIKPFTGTMIFGPEKYQEVVEDWDKKVQEK